MPEVSHTPLPWHDQSREMTDNSLVIANGHGREVCQFNNGRERRYDAKDEEDMANARYIVRACNLFPRLVKVLEDLLPIRDSGLAETYSKEIEAMESILALAKADEGETRPLGYLPKKFTD